MTDSLDVVAIGIEKECAVGVGVVVRAKPRRPIVRSSGSEAGAMTCVHFGAQCNGKCNMDPPGRSSAIANLKERFGSAPKPACASEPVCSTVVSFKSTNESGKSVCS